ncbi:hypothetical protein BJY52DRAFT_1223344 [Lactarius psammicola]|nr:hypothetical protein BJY52DRAFT_1223344 [Lactarius psammicola]
MLAMFTSPHPSTPRSSSDSSQPWSKVCAWLSRERGRAGRLLQVALGAARAASASPNVVPPRPRHRTAIDEIVWHSRPEVESRPARDDTHLAMFEWVNIRRAGEEKVDRALPALPQKTEKEGKIYAVKRKPVPSLDNFHDEGLHEARAVETGGLGDETHHGGPYTWPVTFSPSSPDFQDSASDQEDSDQDSYDQDMDMEHLRGDSESEVDVWDRGLVVAEMCNKWGWTLEDVLETLEQPSQEGRRKCLREKGVLHPGDKCETIVVPIGKPAWMWCGCGKSGHNTVGLQTSRLQTAHLTANQPPISKTNSRMNESTTQTQTMIIGQQQRLSQAAWRESYHEEHNLLSLGNGGVLRGRRQGIQERQQVRVSERTAFSTCGAVAWQLPRGSTQGEKRDRMKAGADFPRALGLSVASSLQQSPNPCILGESYDGVGCAVQDLREKPDTVTPSHRRRTEYVGRGHGSRNSGARISGTVSGYSIEQVGDVYVEFQARRQTQIVWQALR